MVDTRSHCEVRQEKSGKDQLRLFKEFLCNTICQERSEMDEEKRSLRDEV